MYFYSTEYASVWWVKQSDRQSRVHCEAILVSACFSYVVQMGQIITMLTIGGLLEAANDAQKFRGDCEVGAGEDKALRNSASLQ